MARGKGGRGRGDGSWTWSAACDVSSNRKGRGRGKGGKGHHLSHVAKSDHRLKQKHTPTFVKGKGKGKGKGPGGCGYKSKGGNGGSSGPPVDTVAEECLGRHTQIRKAHGSNITCIAMADMGIYTGSTDKSLKRWKPVRGSDGRFELQPDITVPLSDSCYSLLHHSGWIFCGLWNGNIQAFSQDGTEVMIKGHWKKVTSLLIHQNILISGSVDREVKLWQMDPGTKSFTCSHTLSDDMPGPISKLLVLGGNLLIAGMSGISVMNLEKLQVTKKLMPTQPIADMLEFQDHVIVAYVEGAIRIFDADGNLKSETKPLAAGQMCSLAGLESGPRLLCGHASGQVSSIVLPNFEFRLHFQALDSCKIESIHCAGHDGIFLLGSSDGTLQLWQRVAG